MQLPRWTRWIVISLVAAAPLAARAQTTAPSPAAEQQEPTPPPRSRVQVHGGDGREVHPPHDGEGPGGGGAVMANAAPPMDRPAPIDMPTADEWDRSEAFLKEHAPKRWAILQNLDEDGQQRVRGFVFWRFRTLERQKNSDPEMYQLNLRRFSLEDEIFGIRFPLRQEGRLATEEERSKLREKVSALVDLSLEERELRVQRLRAMLKREEDFLNAERNARDAAINERLSLIEQGRGMGIGRGGGYSNSPQRAPDREPQPSGP